MNFELYTHIWNTIATDEHDWHGPLLKALRSLDKRIDYLQEVYEEKVTQEDRETGEQVYQHIANEIKLMEMCFVALTEFYEDIISQDEEAFEDMMKVIHMQKKYDMILHVHVPEAVYDKIPFCDYDNVKEECNQLVTDYINEKYID